MPKNKKPNKVPRKLSLVRLDRNFKKSLGTSKPPYLADLPLVFLGEIKNMPAHGVFVGHRSGKIYSGYHISNFEEIPEDEFLSENNRVISKLYGRNKNKGATQR